MKIDLYHLYHHLHFSNLAYPIVLDVLKVWAESIGWEVRVFVCKEAKADLSTDADVVGISVYTQTAPAAYRIAEQLRRRGKVVILGGPHFRGPATYKEALSRCVAVVNSICEEQWRALLNDIARGKISSNLEEPPFIVDTEKKFRYPSNFYEALRSKKWYQIPSVPTSIGCPYDCSFCSPYLQGQYILRDIETIGNEVAHTSGKIVFICDATFGLRKRFTVQLMETLAPLGKKMGVETTLARLKDEEILNAMAVGGVKWLIVGIENLGSKLVKHGTDHLEDSLKQVVNKAHELGMHVLGNLICGLDCDGPESFEHMYNFCMTSNLDSIMIGILTPYPNTRLFEQLRSAGRIIDNNWEHYDCYHVVYRPRRMTVDQLIDGYIELYRGISNNGSLIKEAIRLGRKNGIRAETTVPMAYKLYSKFDLKKKQRVLRSLKENDRPRTKP